MPKDLPEGKNQVSSSLGRFVLRHAAERGKNLDELQAVLAKTRAGLKKVLSGETPLTVDELSDLASWLEVPIASLLYSALNPSADRDIQTTSDPVEPTVTVLVPVHNEERTVAHVVEQLVSQKLSAKLEIIVVDDGSTDKTAQILADLEKVYEITVLRLEKNVGKGNAVRAGIAKATGTHMLIFDADSEYDPHDLEYLIRPILRQRADLVFGVRVQGVNTTHPTLLHAIGNKLMTFTTNILYGSSITDLHTCLKLVRLSVLRSLDLSEKGFGLDTEITAELLRRGYRPYEVPISYIGRSKAEGKHIHAGDAIRCFYVLAKVRFRSNSREQMFAVADEGDAVEI